MSATQKLLLISISTLALISCSNFTSPPTTKLAATTCLPKQVVLPSTKTPIDQGHIFCGEVKSGIAKGFHSAANATFVSTILAETTITMTKITTTTTTKTSPPPTSLPPTPLPPPLIFNLNNTQIYKLFNFIIHDGSNSAVKSNSTMFPNSCTASQVLMSIDYAYNHKYDQKNPIPTSYNCDADANSRCGPSSPIPVDKKYCLVFNKPIPLQTFFDGKTITTAYPIF